MIRFLPAGLIAACLAAPAFADQVSGEVLAYDRVAEVVILDDRSVWSLKDGKATAPEGLEAGDRVTITFQSAGDNGYGRISALTIDE